MKRLKISVLLVLSVLFLSMASSKTVYASQNPYYDMIQKYRGQLNEQKWGQLDTWAGYMYKGFYQEYYDGWICSGALGDGTVIEILGSVTP